MALAESTPAAGGYLVRPQWMPKVQRPLPQPKWGK
jgi:hypothetical protein